MPGFLIGSTSGDSRSPSSTAEFHRSHRWRIENLGIPASSGGGGTVSSPGSGGLELYAQSIKLPTLQFEKEIVQGGSGTYNFAKMAPWQNVDVTFYDVFGLFELIEGWQKLIWNSKTGMGVANDYYGEPQFILLDGQGAETVRFKLFGAWPESVTHGEMSYTISEIKSVTISYSYNWAETTFK